MKSSQTEQQCLAWGRAEQSRQACIQRKVEAGWNEYFPPYPISSPIHHTGLLRSVPELSLAYIHVGLIWPGGRVRIWPVLPWQIPLPTSRLDPPLQPPKGCSPSCHLLPSGGLQHPGHSMLLQLSALFLIKHRKQEVEAGGYLQPIYCPADSLVLKV